MLIDTQYKNKNLIVSYVDSNGDIKLKSYNWSNPKKYEICEDNDPNRHPKYKSWDGRSVKKVDCTYPDRYSVYEFLDFLPEEENKEIFDFNLPKIYFIDIETEIVDSFPEAKDIFDKNGNLVKEGAVTKVLSISIVYDDKIILLGLRDLSQMAQDRIRINTNKYFKNVGNVEYKLRYVKYDDEFDMLYSFFNKVVPKMPVLTGWNFTNYDWLYLVNRAKKLKKYNNSGKLVTIKPEVSSPTKKLRKLFGADFEQPYHRMIFDYMQLYEFLDTSIKVKESSSLDFVSSKLVGVDKIKYVNSIYKLESDISFKGFTFKSGDICRKDSDIYYMYNELERIEFNQREFNSIRDNFKEINVSNLQKLYEEDFEIYMYYNAVDSVLVQKIHDARNYISIIFAISSLAKIKTLDVISYKNGALASLVITEGVLRNRFRENENIVLFKEKKNYLESTISGGWVKEPVVGLNKWVVCYDFASLYPTTQRQFFIAPENFVGIKSPVDDSVCTNGKKIDKDKHVVCVNGSVFEKKISPTLKMLEDVYSDRKKNKKIMMSKKEELKQVLNEIEKLESEI